MCKHSIHRHTVTIKFYLSKWGWIKSLCWVIITTVFNWWPGHAEELLNKLNISSVGHASRNNRTFIEAKCHCDCKSTLAGRRRLASARRVPLFLARHRVVGSPMIYARHLYGTSINRGDGISRSPKNQFACDSTTGRRWNRRTKSSKTL